MSRHRFTACYIVGTDSAIPREDDDPRHANCGGLAWTADGTVYCPCPCHQQRDRSVRVPAPEARLTLPPGAGR